MSAEVWGEVYDRLAELVGGHRTTLIFANTRRMVERLTRHLAERIGEGQVAAHHGSLAKELRFDAEKRLQRGELKALVATASLELGIDIGEVDLVCQLGSPRSIATFLQRVGRSGHAVDGTPKGRLFPLSRVICAMRGLIDSTGAASWTARHPRAAARRAGPADRGRGRHARVVRAELYACAALLALPLVARPQFEAVMRCWAMDSRRAAAAVGPHPPRGGQRRLRGRRAPVSRRSPPVAHSDTAATRWCASAKPVIGTVNEVSPSRACRRHLSAGQHGLPHPARRSAAGSRREPRRPRPSRSALGEALDAAMSCPRRVPPSRRDGKRIAMTAVHRAACLATIWIGRSASSSSNTCRCTARSVACRPHSTIVLERFFDEAGGMQR